MAELLQTDDTESRRRVILKEFDPLSTDAEFDAFGQKVTKSGQKAIEVQKKRLEWMEEKLAEVYKRGKRPQLITYEYVNKKYYPVFNPDVEFKYAVQEQTNRYNRWFIHLPTGLKGQWKTVLDYKTGRIRFYFFNAEAETRNEYDAGGYYLRGEFIPFDSGPKFQRKTVIVETPIAEYSAALCKPDLPRIFDTVAKRYKFYVYKYNSLPVAEDENGNPIAWWSEDKRRWVTGKLNDGWRPSEEFVNFAAPGIGGKLLYADEQEMAKFQGLWSGIPSATLLRLYVQASEEIPEDNIKDPKYRISAEITGHQVENQRQDAEKGSKPAEGKKEEGQETERKSGYGYKIEWDGKDNKIVAILGNNGEFFVGGKKGAKPKIRHSPSGLQVIIQAKVDYGNNRILFQAVHPERESIIDFGHTSLRGETWVEGSGKVIGNRRKDTVVYQWEVSLQKEDFPPSFAEVGPVEVRGFPGVSNYLPIAVITNGSSERCVARYSMVLSQWRNDHLPQRPEEFGHYSDYTGIANINWQDNTNRINSQRAVMAKRQNLMFAEEQIYDRTPYFLQFQDVDVECDEEEMLGVTETLAVETKRLVEKVLAQPEKYGFRDAIKRQNLRVKLRVAEKLLGRMTDSFASVADTYEARIKFEALQQQLLIHIAQVERVAQERERILPAVAPIAADLKVKMKNLIRRQYSQDAALSDADYDNIKILWRELSNRINDPNDDIKDVEIKLKSLDQSVNEALTQKKDKVTLPKLSVDAVPEQQETPDRRQSPLELVNELSERSTPELQEELQKKSTRRDPKRSHTIYAILASRGFDGVRVLGEEEDIHIEQGREKMDQLIAQAQQTDGSEEQLSLLKNMDKKINILITTLKAAKHDMVKDFMGDDPQALEAFQTIFYQTLEDREELPITDEQMQDLIEQVIDQMTA
ncbi:hypothetical protein HYW46_01670 [Candidatus Daviesbacteria bacterium]|nr:hypothetical protein [Candidatus Daviesbacteria bacterium]